MAAAAAQLERDLAAISLRDLAAIELSISPAISAAEAATSEREIAEIATSTSEIGVSEREITEIGSGGGWWVAEAGASAGQVAGGRETRGEVPREVPDPKQVAGAHG